MHIYIYIYLSYLLIFKFYKFLELHSTLTHTKIFVMDFAFVNGLSDNWEGFFSYNHTDQARSVKAYKCHIFWNFGEIMKYSYKIGS